MAAIPPHEPAPRRHAPGARAARSRRSSSRFAEAAAGLDACRCRCARVRGRSPVGRMRWSSSRHLVGLDELHLVRLRVRHRRRAVSAGGVRRRLPARSSSPRACGRCSRAGRECRDPIGGYVVMRLALVAQWLRAAASDPDHRTTALRYAIGVSGLQVAWIAVLFLSPPWLVVGFVRVRGTRAVRSRLGRTRRHDDVASASHRRTLRSVHVDCSRRVDRAATMAIQAALGSGQALGALVPIIVGGLPIV